MQWLGLDLSPDNSVEDLLRGRSAATDLGPSSVDWFLNTDSWPQDAIACQIMDQYTVDDKMKILLKKLDTNAIEQILGYQFRQKSFIIQAMTHSSYSGNKLTDSYERLEVSILFTNVLNRFQLDINIFLPNNLIHNSQESLDETEIGCYKNPRLSCSLKNTSKRNIQAIG
jgi:hypothetical protein